MKVNSAADFGLMIRKRRKELGYTQGCIAEYTGLSASFISNLENGKETAEIGKAIYLCKSAEGWSMKRITVWIRFPRRWLRLEICKAAAGSGRLPQQIF